MGFSPRRTVDLLQIEEQQVPRRLRRPPLRGAHDPLQPKKQRVPHFSLGRLATEFMNNPG